MTLQDARRNVVYFPANKGGGYGCGFFITPHDIITAGHVLKRDNVGDSVNFCYQGTQYTAQLVKRSPNPYQEFLPPDVALLHTDHPIGPACEYTLDLPVRDEKLTARIARLDGQIEEYAFEQDGSRYAQDTPDIPDIIGLSRHAAIVPGWSGSPVFRSSDSRVIGYLRITRDARAGQGGYFVPLARIVKDLPELQLQTTYEKSDLPDTLENIFDLLTYTSRLTPFIGSMNAELNALEAWAIGGKACPQIRLLSGPGGSGKSRLAFELIHRVRQHGIPADFFGESSPGDAQALVVVDYPEQQVAQLDRYLKTLVAKSLPIRVLLLSRRPLQDLIQDLQKAGVGRILDGHSVAMSCLSNAEVGMLYHACSRALDEKYTLGIPEIADHDLSSWISQNAALHTLPLFVRALALEVALSGHAALGFSTERLVQGLVDRERQRLRIASLGAGFEDQSLSVLSAFAAIRPNLGWEDIKSFQAPELEVFTGPFGKNRLTNLPWFHANTWLAPSPDSMAAALVYTVFKDNDHMATTWLWKLLQGADQNTVATMARLLSDIGRIFGSGQIEFSMWLTSIIDQYPERAGSLREFTTTSSHALGDFGAAIGSLLAQNETATPENRAALLFKLSTCLSASGERVKALKAMQESVEILQSLAQANPAAFEPDLAASLTNLAYRLSYSGDRVGALNASQESVRIYQNLTKANPAVFEPNLALGYNNLSNSLSESGERVGALNAIQQSVRIYQNLAQANPAVFEPDLARGLSNLSLRLSDTGDRVGALSAIQQSVGIYHNLAQANPAVFEPDLAGSLNNLSNHLSESGDGIGALKAIQDAVEILQRLAKANPTAFTSKLALGLNNLSNQLSDSGNRAGALTAVQTSVEIYRRLAESNPPAFEADLARALNNLSNSLSKCGDRIGAFKTIRESVEIRRRLAKANPPAFEPDLAFSLRNLSHYLGNAGDRVAALQTIQESVEIYQRLDRANPSAFDADLASSLNFLAKSLSDSGNQAGALHVSQKSVAIYQRLATANPAAFEVNLALALNGLSIYLSDCGDHLGALQAIEEAIKIRRRLAEANPAAYEPALALALHNLSNYLGNCGNRVGALKAIEESIGIYQKLANLDPPAFEPDLALGLNNLSLHLRASGDSVEALRTIQESVAIYQRLAKANPAAFEPALAHSLNTLSYLQSM